MSTHTGLIGWPVAHSLSPVIHQFWREQYNIPGHYTLYPVNPDTMEADIRKLKASGVRGFNVTVPHKEAIQPFLDTVDEAAHHIGAVNAVIRDGATWRGTNTDAYGFITHLRHRVGSLKTVIEHVVILGAGGAARAAIVALKEAGAEHILILNRTKATADALAAEFHVKSGEWEAQDTLLHHATLLVNTTVLGMAGKPPLTIDLTGMEANAVVYDIVYTPLDTPLLTAARNRGLQAVDGLGMLLYQAQMAFHEWHGVFPDVGDGVRQALLTEMAQRAKA